MFLDKKLFAAIDLQKICKMLPQMLDYLPIKIYIKDENSRMVYANRTQWQFMGLSSMNEAIGKCDHDFIATEVADQTRADELRILATGVPLLGKKEPIQKINGENIQGMAYKYRYIDEFGTKFIIGFSADITEQSLLAEAQSLAMEKLEKLVREDQLTGAFSRRYFIEFLDQAIKRGKRDKEVITLLYIDLDDFKLVNDIYGHAAGDYYLQEFVQRLKACLREVDIVGRLGGDEFVVILHKTDDRQKVETVCQKIIREMTATSLKIGADDVPLKASIGVSLYPMDGFVTADDLIKNGDSAMYQAKSRKSASTSFSVFFYGDIPSVSGQ